MHPTIKNMLVLAIALVFLLLVYQRWFFHLDILTAGDWSFLYAETIKSNFLTENTWSSSGFGEFNVVLSFFFVYKVLIYLLSFLEFKFILRLLFMAPTVFVGFFSLFLLTKKMLGNNLSASLVAATVFSFNTYYLILQTGHLTLATAFAFSPLAILFFIKTMTDKRLTPALATGLVCSIVSVYEARAFYIVAWVLSFYYLYYTFLIDKISKKNIIRNSIYAAIPILVTLMLSAYWIIPLTTTRSLQSNSVLGRGLFGSNFMFLTNSFTLFHPFWAGAAPTTFINQPIPGFFWLIPVLAFLGLIFGRKNKHTVFFGIIAVLGIFLAKQSAAPFPGAYLWLYEHIPGFNAFREASKFYYLLGLGYSILIGSLVASFWQNQLFKKWPAHVRLFIAMLVMLLFLNNAIPVVTGTIGTIFVPRHIPADNLIFKDFLLNQPGFFRTSWVPTVSRWSIYTSQKPMISNITIINSTWQKYLWERPGYQSRPFNGRLIELFQINGSNELFDISSIKYVIVPLQDIANDDDFFVHFGGRENPNIRQWYIEQLDKVPYLKKIDIGTKELAVYENDGYKPYITAAPAMVTLTNLSNLDDTFSCITDQLKQDFVFTETLKDVTENGEVQANGRVTVPSTFIQSVFEDVTPENISADKIRVAIKPPFSDTSLYINKSWLNDPDNNGRLLVNGRSVNDLLTSNSPQSMDYYSVQLTSQGENVFEYELPEGMGRNIIPNPSLEQGLWPAPSSKCLDHDRTGLLEARVDNDFASDGNQSLQVQSSSVSSCAGLGPLPVKAGSSYLLSFDYQSDRDGVAGYRLDFDNGKDIDEPLSSPNTDWQRFNQMITIPKEATNLTLLLYSHVDEDTRYQTARYDNFRLMAVPDLHDQFYLVSTPGQILHNPAAVDFDILMPTKKLARIKGATTPFYLNMSESYHDQWRLMIDNNKVRGRLLSWIPWAAPDAVANEHHYKLNSFLNGWYVDTNELCVKRNLCRQNADGSYDLDMVIEFWPQRWFYIGLIISGLTLIGCLGYLGYAGSKFLILSIKGRKPPQSPLTGGSTIRYSPASPSEAIGRSWDKGSGEGL